MDKFFTRPQRVWFREAGKTAVMYSAAIVLLYQAAWKTNWLIIAAADVKDRNTQQIVEPTENQ